jgi:hypothetical protein
MLPKSMIAAAFAVGTIALPSIDVFATTISGTWTPLTNAFPGTATNVAFGPGINGPDTALLLTDGSVVVHEVCTPNWYRLVPDQFGSYINGSWSVFATGDNKALAPMIGSGNAPDGYGPLFYASTVLPDGRLIVNGGEAENSTGQCSTSPAADSSKGSLYNPHANTWSAVPSPPGWTKIGDAGSVLLGPNNATGGYAAATYMLQNCCDAGATGRQVGFATIAPFPGTAVTWVTTSVGKADANNEEGWILLPNGQVLTVDASAGSTLAELFNPQTNTWSSAGNTSVSLVSTTPPGELGPGVGIGYNMVVQFGGNNHTAIFTFPNKWTAGPDFPSPQEVADGPAALLPNGNILVQSGNAFNPPSNIWEFSTAGMTPQTPGVGTLTAVNNPPCNDATLTNVGAFQGRMLVLPTGQILWDASEGVNCTSVYTPNAGDGTPNLVMRPPPHINTISNTTLGRGNTNYTLTGSMFRGVSQGATYGDDAQMATNYPMVRITNNTTNHVCWGRTHDWGILTSTQFDVPPDNTGAGGNPDWALVENPCETGASTLVVITNGLVSNPITVTIN